MHFFYHTTRFIEGDCPIKFSILRRRFVLALTLIKFINKNVFGKKMEDKLKTIMSEALEINKEEITNESSIYNIDNWDSLSHLRLISTIEDAFDITFTEEELLNLTSFSNIVSFLKEKNI